MNLIRMNFSRMFKMTSFYICLIFLTLSCTLVCISQKMSTPCTEEEQQIIDERYDCDVNRGVGITFSEEQFQFAAEMMVDITGSGLLLVVIAFFTTLFTGGERNSGYLKNLNSCCKRKGMIFWSKIPGIAMFSLLLLLICTLIPCCFMPFGGSLRNWLVFFLVEWLLHTAFGVFIMMIMEIFRNNMAGILFGIFGAIGLPLLIITLIFGSILKMDWIANYANCLVVTRAREYAMEGLDRAVTCLPAALLSALVFGSLYVIIGLGIYRKRDLI